MIVATAGHVDHGKTSLVRALTGIDTDRLPEEKQRNLTIDLGFAYVPLEDGGVLGFVDVPGHERFIRNMLCGVAAVDYALVVVAADDGVMPQTEEHLAILDLLGVEAGAVAITKTDRVDPGRVDEVAEEVELYLDETRLAGAACFPVSSVDGSGMDALKAHLESVAHTVRRRPAGGHFRLAVDRAFTVVGAGLVVTGTAFSGSVSVDDRLLLSPARIPVRVRGIHAQDRKAERGRAGERLALNIVGQSLGRDDVARGDWVVEEAAHLPARRIDATVRILSDETRPVAHWTPVHVHLAAADVTGRLALLEARSLAPGESGLAQLVLDRPIGAMHGDRFVLRDQSGDAHRRRRNGSRRAAAGARTRPPSPARLSEGATTTGGGGRAASRGGCGCGRGRPGEIRASQEPDRGGAGRRLLGDRHGAAGGRRARRRVLAAALE